MYSELVAYPVVSRISDGGDEIEARILACKKFNF